MTIARALQFLAVILFALATVTPADAQRDRYRDRDDDRRSESKKVEQMFPKATRSDRTPKTSARFNRDFQRMVDLANKDNFTESLELAEKIIGNPKATADDRAVAMQNASYSASQLDDYAKALDYVERALKEDALSNNTHFQMMRQAAQMRLGEEQYAEGLAHVDRFMQETGVREPEMLALKGNALYRLERFEEAIATLREAIDAEESAPDSWRQLLMACYFELERPLEAAKIAEEVAARTPDDKRAQMQLAAIYAQGDLYDKATEVLERARARGMLTEERDYRQLYAMYFNMEGKENEAIAVIEEGLQKGILKDSAEVHVALAQAFYFTDRTEKAIEHYRRAVPLASDGEPALNLARLLSNEDRPAETKAAAQDALTRGVRRPGDAWMIIGRAEHGLNNQPAMIAAYREAAKFPETKAQAEEWLKKNARR